MALEIERLPADRLDEVEHVWASLLEHHGRVAPQMPPVRDAAESWRRRRADYDSWLADEGSFALVAREAGEVVGYAVVHVGPGDETWSTAERLPELETLAVVPEARGRGVGGALMDAVEAELERAGLGDLTVGVVSSNERALRFYERRGLEPYLTYLWRRRTV